MSINEKQILKDISFDITIGERLGLVGESGCGKTLLAQLSMGFIPSGGKIQGDVLFKGNKLFDMKEKQLRDIRGSKIGYTFQDPYTAMDPVFRTGYQVAEVLIGKGVCKSRKDARKLAIETMKQMGIKFPDVLLDSYPFQLSGGMIQRLYIAMVLMLSPELFIADEPVSSLDAVTQSCVVNLIRREIESRGSALLFITHDLSLLSHVVDRIVVMLKGVIVEDGPVEQVSKKPYHPYTRFLYNHEIKEISECSNISDNSNYSGCPFTSFCTQSDDVCKSKMPEMKSVNGSRVRCHRF